MSVKQLVTHLLRKAGLLGFVEHFRSLCFWFRTYALRTEFARAHPDFALPPWGISYDAYASFNPYAYRETGLKHAELIHSYIRKYAEQPVAVVCDWGCGPLRVLRHFPGLMGGEGTKFLGLDYNPDTIAWAKANFTDIEFRKNELSPPLPLADNEVDVLYCISVFTHLSRQVFDAYVDDIYRALKPGGILIMTLHGDKCAANLLPAEKEKYAAGEYVERGGVQEGKRTYVAYHHPEFVIKSFRAYKLLEHNPVNAVTTFQQDWWIFQKPRT